MYSPGVHCVWASRYRSPRLLSVTLQVFMWHSSCRWGHDTCVNALLWSGEVWSEFAWSWSCDAFQQSDAFMPRKAASPALSWLGVSVPPWEATQELPTQGCSGRTNSGKSFIFISNYLPVAKIWCFCMKHGCDSFISLLPNSRLSKAVADLPEPWNCLKNLKYVCIYMYIHILPACFWAVILNPNHILVAIRGKNFLHTFWRGLRSTSISTSTRQGTGFNNPGDFFLLSVSKSRDPRRNFTSWVFKKSTKNCEVHYTVLRSDSTIHMYLF